MLSPQLQSAAEILLLLFQSSSYWCPPVFLVISSHIWAVKMSSKKLRFFQTNFGIPFPLPVALFVRTLPSISSCSDISKLQLLNFQTGELFYIGTHFPMYFRLRNALIKKERKKETQVNGNLAILHPLFSPSFNNCITFHVHMLFDYFPVSSQNISLLSRVYYCYQQQVLSNITYSVISKSCNSLYCFFDGQL